MQPRAEALVLFGATGDLAKRKLFPALYHLARHGQLDVPIIGVAKSSWKDREFRDHALGAIRSAVADVDERLVGQVCERLDLVGGDYGDIATFQALAARLDLLGTEHAVFYLAIPPSMFETVIQSLAAVGLNKRGRVVVEKPFGRDLDSARELNRCLHESFPEERIFRIDHYLGKESVEDLLVFRFSNSLLEPIWNRNYVSSVQLTMAEDIGVEGRGSFYDSVGALRDVVQNHLLQVVALLAMEPPVDPSSRALQDEKAKVFSQMQPIDPIHMVRGQYRGYLDEPGVAEGSTTETYVALRLMIDSWRWAGVPWYVRAGKGLARSATEAVVELKKPPRMLFDEAGGPEPEANLVCFRLGRQDGVTFRVQAKTPGVHLDSESVDLSVDFASALGERREAYERLLGDAIEGNPRRFARQDVVELTWSIVQPALAGDGPVRRYDRGSWGPGAAEALLQGGTWHEPS
ncbi:MAG TPA: glucose-6-phosphate dehydrogenase [Acidimicrobiales bacterium]